MTDPAVRETIMAATYEALCAHGYTDLTAQDIADRTDKSKSLLFYHYDSKTDLIADFIEYLIERFDERVAELDSLPPVERLAMFVDWFLYGHDGDERQSFHTALLELRAQAPYNDQYRRQLRHSDDRLRGTLEAILQDGIDAGAFHDHDTTAVAALLIAAFDGARIRHLTLESDDYLDRIRSATVRAVLHDILTDDVTFPADRRPVAKPTGPDRTGIESTLGQTAVDQSADTTGEPEDTADTDEATTEDDSKTQSADRDRDATATTDTDHG